jgi:hypothetical protein
VLGDFPDPTDRDALLFYWYDQSELGVVYANVTVDGQTTSLGPDHVVGFISDTPLPDGATRPLPAAGPGRQALTAPVDRAATARERPRTGLHAPTSEASVARRVAHPPCAASSVGRRRAARRRRAAACERPRGAAGVARGIRARGRAARARAGRAACDRRTGAGGTQRDRRGVGLGTAPPLPRVARGAGAQRAAGCATR